MRKARRNNYLTDIDFQRKIERRKSFAKEAQTMRERGQRTIERIGIKIKMNGKIYESARSAAGSIGGSGEGLVKAIKKGHKTFKGVPFEVIPKNKGN